MTLMDWIAGSLGSAAQPTRPVCQQSWLLEPVFILVLSVLGESESVEGEADGLSQKSTEDARIEVLSWLGCGEGISPSPVD